MIELRGLGKTFQTANGDITALRDISLTIEDGEIFGIIGLSGAGKSTLVRCINLLERPTAGDVLVDGKSLLRLSRRELLETRRSIGMIFQSFNLLEQRSVLRNVCYPLEIAGTPKEAAKARARELLALVGLADREKAYPAQLSGGQKQRVAIARALATKPRYLLCDEATSALDVTVQKEILDLLRGLEGDLAILFICHDISLVQQFCHRVLVMHRGEIVEQGTPDEVICRPQHAYTRHLIDSVL